jgi:trk system potassium uptake protein TrkA
MRFVIIGAGQVGESLARFLSRTGEEVVVIERDAERCAALEEDLDVEIICGSGTHLSSLRQAGLERTGMFVAVTDSDETNLMCSLLASQLLPESATRMARVRQHEYYNDPGIPAMFKVDFLVNPEDLLALRVQRILSIPGARDVLVFEEGQVYVVAFEISKESPLVGRSLAEIGRDMKDNTSMVGAILRQASSARSGRKLLIPGGKDELMPGDLAYFLAPKKALDDLVKLQRPAVSPVKSILIGGGGEMSIHLASVLQGSGWSTKLMIDDPELARRAAERLSGTVVIQASPADLELLDEQLSDGVDTYIAASQEDTLNVLTAQFAHKLGVTRTIVVTRDPQYVKMLRAVDVDVALNPFDLAASFVLRNVHQVNVLEVNLFAGEDAEAFEFVPPKDSPVFGKPLKTVKFPKSTLVALIKRGDGVILPRGDDAIQPDDRVIIFCKRGSVGALERVFSPSWKW